MRRSWLWFLCALVAGCGADDVAHQSGKIAVVDTYERAFHFDAPVACDLFLHRRVTDEQARLVEYDARVDEVEVTAVYTLDATAPRPLGIQVLQAGTPSFSVAMSDHDLVALDPGGQTLLEVAGYDGAQNDTRVAVSGRLPSGEGLALLACALPVRSELGPVPQFLLNRATGGRDPNQPDVSHSSSNAPPILDWTGKVSLLGADLLAGVCLRVRTWACPCLAGFSSLAGPVPGWCSGPAARNPQ